MRHRWNRWTRALTMAAAIVSAVSAARAQPQLERAARVAGRPNFNGIWQPLNMAYWPRRVDVSPNEVIRVMVTLSA